MAVCVTLIFLVGCARNQYRVVEREDRYVDKMGRQVSGFSDPLSDHDEVHFVLAHAGRKIHAICDLNTLDRLDPNASCALRPLREYICFLNRDSSMKALSDLTCKDEDGRNVYLYVSKEE